MPSRMSVEGSGTSVSRKRVSSALPAFQANVYSLFTRLSSALRKQIQDTSLSATKAYNAAEQAEQALAYAQKLAVLNQQVPLPKNDMTALKAELQARLESGIAAI